LARSGKIFLAILGKIYYLPFPGKNLSDDHAHFYTKKKIPMSRQRLQKCASSAAMTGVARKPIKRSNDSDFNAVSNKNLSEILPSSGWAQGQVT